MIQLISVASPSVSISSVLTTLRALASIIGDITIRQQKKAIRLGRREQYPFNKDTCSTFT